MASESILIDKKRKVENALKIRQGFTILAKGIEVIHYTVPKKRTARTLFQPSIKEKDRLWLDVNSLRLCIKRTRPSAVEKAEDYSLPGIYLRDISTVKEGADAFEFVLYPNQNDIIPECCLAIIGSECAICMQLPNKKVRDWFLKRFRLMVCDMLSIEELKLNRERRAILEPVVPFEITQFTDDEINQFNILKDQLIAGIQINHHFGEHVVMSLFRYDSEDVSFFIEEIELNRGVIQHQTQELVHSIWSGISTFTSTICGYFYEVEVIDKDKHRLPLSDVVDIRFGTHSYGFVLTHSTDKHGHCLAIIGSKCTMNIECANIEDLKKLERLLLHFVRFCLVQQRKNVP